MSATETEADILEALDFEHETPCEANHAGTPTVCSVTVRWRSVKKCCHMTKLVCDSARAFDIGGGRAQIPVWICPACGHRKPKAEGALSTFAPIGS